MSQNIIDASLHELKAAISRKENCSVFGLTLGEKIFLISGLKRQCVFVTNSMTQANKLAEQLSLQNKTVKTMFYVRNEFSLNTHVAGSNVYDSIDALISLSTKKVDCLIISPEVLTQKFSPKKVFIDSLIEIRKDTQCLQTDLISKLISVGYRRIEIVSVPGEFSVRGDIVDVFNILDQFPTRIEFFDNTVERISSFSLTDFKRIKDEIKVLIAPTCLALYDGSKKQFIESQLKMSIEQTISKLDPNQAILLKNNYENFKLNFSENNYQSIENWCIPFFDNISIEKYLDSDSIIIFDDVKQNYDSVKNFYSDMDDLFVSQEKSGYIFLGQKNYLIPFDEVFKFSSQLISFQQISTANKIFSPDSVFSYKSSAETNYCGNFKLLIEDLKYYLEYENTVILFCKTKANADYLFEYLNLNQIESGICGLDNIKKNAVNIIIQEIPYGAIFVEDKLVIIGVHELYKKEVSKKIAVTEKKEEFTMPKVGDYVVHETFGIGKCIGIEKLKFTDYQKDYIILQYDRGDKLYLPTEQISLISAYVGGGKDPKLNRLGTKDFEETKKKVKSSLKKLAFDLVKLYSEREHLKGFKYEVDKQLFSEFENSFPHDETEDQLSAIHDIMKDMTSGKVMDRLVCGDVGYGKTEVALRSAFIAVSNNKQVCFMAPTTVLSEQHFNTAKERFAGFGITIECINRFKTKQQQNEILKRLKKGEIDILCGTHRLLSKDVIFKDLGLLILDEEQRFGVADKEKIKTLKTNIDVLTLSATPIPRTLHMGLVGIRDISIISTPPIGRLPVQTSVSEYSDAIVLQAINRELSRDGQVLIIYNRVESIYTFAQHIRSLLPTDVPIGVAHGQMDEKQLENEIYKLYDGQTKILISTTLIENGIDLPNANTLIIIDADKLGLSQLYQLKGRVGRSNNLGYAYLTYKNNVALTEDAYKRLNAIMEFTELGSGFKIAMRDLEIRGCGNILGAEQSGHMAKVGYDLYIKILNEAVGEIRGQKLKEYKDIKIDVAINCYIPETYILESDERFRIYSELKQIQSSKNKEKILGEISNVYGEIPSELDNLSYVALLRNVAREFDVKRIVINRTNCQAEFYTKEGMLNCAIAEALKENEIKTYFSQTGSTMNFMLSEYTVKRKLQLISESFEKALAVISVKKS